ncbi:nucleoside-diphosphate-sugar epimerase [Friedmanniella endophytica]|uniref:Nucleoside-diphosphate-sugar epimerase n=1 Tax=Microlunatus kandeliicorticis TaxID=1759536 RepID=A0A7W3IQS8_9ACTN|nr:NAD(P)-dependent oxidoreductase [Microlunatus kandeliicorticis]MBA8793522.1 nucleoside-diphosphate-sugar epimerase [Microlunatus kandeliicorticis]
MALGSNGQRRRIAVTGGSGKLGRVVVRHLADRGDEVVSLDRTPDPDWDGAFVRVDLTDYGQVAEVLTGIDDRYDRIDAVVHLAAIPAPGLIPNAATFANNITSSFHVYQAAKLANITKIVWASSETVLGLPFDTPPDYLPVDEDVHRPESTYSLVKHLEETMAVQFCRWNPELSMIGLRFSNVMVPADYAGFEDFQDDPTVRKWNYWSYIDARDGAAAVACALDHDQPGADVFVIANPDSVMRTPTAELLAQVAPDVPLRRELGEHEPGLDSTKARTVLGWTPQHSWRDHV